MRFGKLDLFLYYYLFSIMHEFAHVIVSLILKVDIDEIVLLPFGVNAKYINLNSSIKELIISSAGPIASLLFAIIFKDKTFEYINICIAFFNLIPIYPMDGGRIIKALITIVLSIFYKNEKAKIKAQKICNGITKICLIIVMGISLLSFFYYQNYYMFVLALYIIYISKEEIKKERIFEIFNYLQKDE
mgnify:CR=1 FL=1